MFVKRLLIACGRLVAATVEDREVSQHPLDVRASNLVFDRGSKNIDTGNTATLRQLVNVRGEFVR